MNVEASEAKVPTRMPQSLLHRALGSVGRGLIYVGLATWSVPQHHITEQLLGRRRTGRSG